jgi:hypothetical protein
MAHHFEGDTRGWVADMAKSIKNPGDNMMFMFAPDVISNLRISNDLGILEYPGRWQGGPYMDLQQGVYSKFNAGARSFPEAITQTTH